MKQRDFMAGIGASVLLALSRSNSQVRVQRPRLLISNTDAFIGLALLRTRYAGGRRPSEDTEPFVAIRVLLLPTASQGLVDLDKRSELVASRLREL